MAIYPRNSQISGTQKHLLGHNRILFRVTVSLGGTNVAFYCTHVQPGQEAQQAEQVRQILVAQTPPQPIILGGDFAAGLLSNDLSPIRTVLRNVFDGFEE